MNNLEGKGGFRWDSPEGEERAQEQVNARVRHEAQAGLELNKMAQDGVMPFVPDWVYDDNSTMPTKSAMSSEEAPILEISSATLGRQLDELAAKQPGLAVKAMNLIQQIGGKRAGSGGPTRL